MPEDDIESDSFSMVSLLLYEKKILVASIFRQLRLQNCKQKKGQIILMKAFLTIRYYKYCIKIERT